jgi:hypothetical protein
MTSESAEDVARRLAGARTGYQLVAYREVALPLFRVELELLVLDRKQLPPIQEYVLRAIAAGFVDTADIAGFLGIEETVVRGAAAELLATDDLVLAGDRLNRHHRLQLTGKGRRTVSEAERVQAIEVVQSVWIDGLTREVLPMPRDERWFPASSVGGRGLVEILPYPRRRPNLQAISLEGVQESVHTEWRRRRDQREIIGLTGTGRALRFAREAVALIYRSPGQEEPLMTFVIDGEPSEAHDTAYAKAEPHAAQRLTPVDWQDARTIAEEVLPKDLLAQAAGPEVSARVDLGREELRAVTEELREAAPTAPENELEQLRERLRLSERRQRALEDELDAYSVRVVPVYEHRTYLAQALEEAQHRLILIAPWIRFEVVDDEFVGELRKLLERGVELWIGYGIREDRTPDRKNKKKAELDRLAEIKVEELAAEYPKLFRLRYFGDTHAKVLICDTRFAIVTSFNWLSFRGDPSFGFRDERGMYVAVPRGVEGLIDDYRERFEQPEDDAVVEEAH